jgi:signal recognition particle receptor subunit beta
VVVFNYTGRELTGKIVYYGPALSGKTTNLEHIYSKTPSDTRGKMVSMKTKAERTLFFDLLPINRGTIGDFKVRFLLYTVPGQVYYNATRKLVLKGADAIVFVADSQRSQLAANIDSLRNLRTNLLEYGMCLDDLPWVITYNKRDMPDAMSIEELERELNPYGVPSYPSIAVSGEGVFETFQKISDMLMERLESQLRGDSSRSASRPAPQQAMPAPYPPDPHPVREPMPSLMPPPHAQPAASREEFVIDRGFDPMTTAVPNRAPAYPPAARPQAPAMPSAAARPSAPPAQPTYSPPAYSPAAAPVSTLQREAPPLVLQRQIVLPVTAGELAGGSRKIRLVLDITIDPTA